MSKLEELIQQYCPDGVEWKTLEEVCEFRAGWGFPEVEQGLTEGKYPFYKVGDMNSSEMFMDTANNYISEETSKKLKCKPAPKGTIIFPKIGATMNTNKKRILTKPSCYDNNVMGLIAKSVNDRFLYYFFSQYKLIDFAKGTGAVPSLDTNRLKKLPIPIPPLPVQEEVVRILDTYTELQAELQAELLKRKQQYEYYRDKLLSFSDLSNWGGQEVSVEWKKLGEVCDFRNGFAFKSNLFTDDGCPIIRITNISENNVDMSDLKFFHMEDYPKSDLSQFAIKNGDILVAMSGATTGKIGTYKGDITAYLNQRTGKFEPKECLNNRFLYHFLQTQVSNMYKMAGGGAQPNLSSNDLKSKIIIPLPPLSVQKQIADILDRFNTLTTDITAGLPAEIEARRKQYEYYRDQLLTFKQK